MVAASSEHPPGPLKATSFCLETHSLARTCPRTEQKIPFCSPDAQAPPPCGLRSFFREDLPILGAPSFPAGALSFPAGTSVRMTCRGSLGGHSPTDTPRQQSRVDGGDGVAWGVGGWGGRGGTQTRGGCPWVRGKWG